MGPFLSALLRSHRRRATFQRMSERRAANPWRNVYAHPCDWDAQYPPLSLPAMFDDAARRWPERPLTEFLGRSTSHSLTCEPGREVLEREADHRAPAGILQARKSCDGQHQAVR